MLKHSRSATSVHQFLPNWQRTLHDSMKSRRKKIDEVKLKIEAHVLRLIDSAALSGLRLHAECRASLPESP